MAVIKPPVDMSLWSSALPLPEDMTPSEIRLSQQMYMFRTEMRIAHDGIRRAFGPINTLMALAGLNWAISVVLLIRAFA